MFGGLEIKSKGSSDSHSKKDASAPAPAPAASAAGSGFSFLNAAVAPAAAPAAGSGFSFLNAAAAPAAAEPAALAPATSGFSFLQEPSTDAPVKSEEEKPAAATSESPPADAAGSAFSFMATTPAPGPPADAKVEEKPAGTADVSSAFSFLSSVPASAVESSIPEPEASTDTSPMSAMKLAASTSISTAFSPAATVAATKSFATAGAGISFGGAAPSAARPKKKKSRAMKVGVGASSSGASPPRPGTGSLPAPSGLPKPTEEPPALQQSTSNTRDEALDAARRAEEFMNKKLREQTAADLEAEKARQEAAARVAAASGKPPSGAKPGAVYDDEMIAAAAAAAVEAQAMNQKGTSAGARGIMGGLFRRSPPTSSSNLSAGGGSRTGSFSGTSGNRPPMPSPVDTNVAKPSSDNSLNSNDGKAAAAPAPAPGQPSAMAAAPAFAPALPPIPAPKSEPPKPQTPQEKLKGLLQVFRQDVEASMGKVTQLRQQRSRLLEEQTRAMTQERLATQQKYLTEQQQMAAAEAEDYELADQLGGVLSSYEKEQQECARMLEHIDMAIKELDSQKKLVVDGVQKCFQTIQTQLQTFESTEESKEHKSDDTFSKKFASTTKHLAQEHERLQNDLKHLERDEELVAEERKEVETTISEQSCDFEKQRDEGKEKLSAMEEEIEELRKQLEAKQAIASQLRNEIAGHDDSILKVRVQFSRQLIRVQKKESTIQENRSEWEAEKAKFQSEKDEHEAEVKAHSEALEAHEKLMTSLKEEIAMADTLQKIVQKEVGEINTTADDEGSDAGEDGDLLGLQAEVVKCEAALSEAREVLKVATSHLESLEAEMGALITKIPELEATKKAAAAKRDFKAAGKASKEIKDATARVKECQEELTGEAVERKQVAECELKNLDEEMQEKRKVALEKEKETGIVSMQKLAERIQHLIETKKEVCGEDYEANRMQGIGAFVLEEQIKSLAMEGKTYGEKYGGWEELIADILPSEANATEKPNDAGEAGEDKPEELAKAEPQEAAEEAAKNAETPNPQASKEMMASFRRLTQELKDIEEKIDAAAESEDYDMAAELSEKLQELMADLEALNLSDNEMAQALIEKPAEAETPAPELAKATTEGAASAIDEAAAALEAAEAAIEEAAETSEAAVEAEPAAGEHQDLDPSTDEQKEPEQKTSMDYSAATEDQPESLSPNDSGDGAEKELDEKKDADASPVEDGFVAVNDGDL